MESLCPEFLSRILKPYVTTTVPLTRPHVTLTFAQSVDAKIAGPAGRQLILSGRESMVMTHWMRTMHDGIMVGIGTALNDNPQLNVRQLPPPTADAPRYPLPRPIVVDADLQLPHNCKLLMNYQNGTGRRPWVLCAPLRQGDETMAARKERLQDAGARIIEIPHSESLPPSRRLSVASILQSLRDLGIKSLMVEGGARIITSFLCENIVDTLIITIAPVLVGNAGVGYDYQPLIQGQFKHHHTEIVGKDTVVCLLGNKG